MGWRTAGSYAAVREFSGIEFGFDREDRHSHANSHTFYLRYVGPLPSGGSVKVDITIREQLVFPLESRPVLRAYDEFSDLPDDRVIQAYSLAETATEKVLALADRARNEPRDLYDLWHLVVREGIDLARLAQAVTAKLAFRGQQATGIQEAIPKKEGRLKALWSARLSNQMAVLPPFDQVVPSRPPAGELAVNAPDFRIESVASPLILGNESKGHCSNPTTHPIRSRRYLTAHQGAT